MTSSSSTDSSQRRSIRQITSTDTLETNRSQASNAAWRVARNSILAGSCSGMISTVVLYPMDVLRTKLQSTPSLHTPWQALQHTLRHGGVPALYTGLALPFAAQAVYKSTVFGVNTVAQEWILWRQKQHNSAPRLSSWDRVACGFGAGAINAALFVTPVEFVRNQMIAQHTAAGSGGSTGNTAKPLYRSSFHLLQYAYQHDWRVLWRGIGWSVARDGIGCAVFFYTLFLSQELLTQTTIWSKRRNREENGDTDNDSIGPTVSVTKPSFATSLVSGGIAGLSFWIVALPLDTIKTWVQSVPVQWQPRPAGAAGTAGVSVLSVSDSIHTIYRTEGNSLVAVLQRLNRGWPVAYGRGIPSAALTILVYSSIYNYLEDNRDEL